MAGDQSSDIKSSDLQVAKYISGFSMAHRMGLVRLNPTTKTVANKLTYTYSNNNGTYTPSTSGSATVTASNDFTGNKPYTADSKYWHIVKATDTSVNTEMSFTCNANQKDYWSAKSSGTDVGYGKYKLIDIQSDRTAANFEATFSYAGTCQTLTLPWYDNYKLEVWGAQGGDSWGAVTGASGSTYANQHDGGMGGYSYGNYSGTAGATLFVTVGGMGKKRSCRKGGTATTTANGNGYNGGGDLGSWDVSGDWYVGGGGGATHVATVTGLLSSLSNQTNKILIVAGGGGGSAFYLALSYQYSGGGYHYGWGGGGGGATGENATHIYSDNAQWTTGGTGANHPSTPLGGGVSGNTTNFGYGTTSRAGGGGGYYGGTSNNCGGGGGSGYIGGVTDGSMQTGVREGNGYAKITSQ